jgi:hypothetical protein
MEQEPKKFPEGYFEKKVEGYNISGKDLTPDGKVNSVAYLEGKKDQAMKPREGEIEKTEEEARFIEFVGKILQKEIDELGIDKKIEISPEQIHFFHERAYFETTDSKGGDIAGFKPINQEICVNKDRPETRLSLYKAVFHEMIHAASFLGFHKEGGEERPGTSKVGYVGMVGAEGQKLRTFNALNEMVTDRLLMELLTKNKEDFYKEFNISKEEKNETIHGYPIEILNTIMKKIAGEKNEDRESVWQRFKRGLFTGGMMHLREVERVFGEKSLRLLNTVDFVGREEEFAESILKIFQIENDKKREKKIDKFLKKEEKRKPKFKGEIISRK